MGLDGSISSYVMDMFQTSAHSAVCDELKHGHGMMIREERNKAMRVESVKVSGK